LTVVHHQERPVLDRGVVEYVGRNQWSIDDPQ
jgi:hypothetical protein